MHPWHQTSHALSRYCGPRGTANVLPRSWRYRKLSTSPPQLLSRNLEVKASPNKGLGIFATETIPAFTEIVSDAPLIALRPSEDLPHAFQRYLALAQEAKAHLMQLHISDNPPRDTSLARKLAQRGTDPASIPEMVKLSAVFTSNAFNVPDDDAAEPGAFRRALFPTISRINHSCVPNAHTNFDPRSGKMAVYTLAAIPHGDEVLIAYFNLLLAREERQARAAKWGFKCVCPACNVDGAGQRKHEERRARVREIELRIFDVTNRNKASEAEIRSCEEQAAEMISIAGQHESLLPQLPIAYDYLATLQILEYELNQAVPLLEKIEGNLERACAAEANITGAESPATQKRRDKKRVFAGVRQKIVGSGVGLSSSA